MLLVFCACIASQNISNHSDPSNTSFDCCDNLTCQDNSDCPCCKDQSCDDLALCAPQNTSAHDPSRQHNVSDAKHEPSDCCDDLTCQDNSGCPCCEDQSCDDLALCAPQNTSAHGSSHQHNVSDASNASSDCCDDLSCQDNSGCPCCEDQSCYDLALCSTAYNDSYSTAYSASDSLYHCCDDLTCQDNSRCPCCQQPPESSICSNMDLDLCSAHLTNVACDASPHRDVTPTSFVIFEAQTGQSYSLGDIVPIMARFPDGVCVIDPGTAGTLCTPTIGLVLTSKENNMPFYPLKASTSMQSVEDQWNVDFRSQHQFYDANGNFQKPWIFLLQVGPGMSTTQLDVNWILIPKECNQSKLSFNTSLIRYPTGTLTPQVTIKDGTLRPALPLIIGSVLCLFDTNTPI